MSEPCEKCPWKGGRGVVWSPETRCTSGILVLGEGPAREEVARGYCFVGAAGKELEKILARAGIARSEVAIENAFACWKPEKARPHEEIRAVEACRERMWRVIEKIKPSGILCLGGRALRSIAPGFARNATSDGLMRHRGSLWTGEEIRAANGGDSSSSSGLQKLLAETVRFVMFTIHSAAIIRRERLERFPAMGYRGVPSLDARRLVNALTVGRKFETVSSCIGLPALHELGDGFVFDLETSLDEQRRPELLGVQSLAGGPVYQMTWDHAKDWAREAFKLRVEKGGHNVQGFDLHVLMKEGIEIREPIFDTMALAGVCEADMARGLYYQSAYYFGDKRPFWKELVGANPMKPHEVRCQYNLRRAWEKHPMTQEVSLETEADWMRFYNMLDVDSDRMVYLEQRKRAESEGWIWAE